MLPEQWKQAIDACVKSLIAGNSEAPCFRRVSVETLAKVLERYHCEPIPLPQHYLDSLEVTPNVLQPGLYVVDVDLWTEREGRSDLTLKLAIRDEQGTCDVEVWDLKVL